MNYEFHPFAEVWQLLEGMELQALKDSLKVNGQRLPIILYEGKILDGRNRYILAKELGIKLRSEVSPAKNDDEAIEHVLDLNDRRKHRSYEERAFAGARLVEFKQGGARRGAGRPSKNKIKGSSETLINDDDYGGRNIHIIARQVGVSASGVKRARKIIADDKQTGGDLEKRVRAKTTTLTQADEVARASGRERKKAKPPNASAKFSKLTTMQALAQRRDLKTGQRILSREDVDPDFVGSELEFSAKYGYVWCFTAHELASQRFSGLALGLRQAEKSVKELVKGQRGDVEKLDKVPHARDIGFLEEAIDYLKPLLAEAELWLQAAKRLRTVRQQVNGETNDTRRTDDRHLGAAHSSQPS